MERRRFLKYGLAAGTGVLALQGTAAQNTLFNSGVLPQEKDKFLNAYYFRAHMYTMVPRHIREDLKWMADIGTDAVTLAILEQDFNSAFENVEFICNEADKLGMSVIGVPSRWGGLLAGAPKVPSVFTVQNPQTWVLKKDGSPVSSDVSGRISSIHYPETFEFMCNSVDKIFTLWNIKGIIWDELKSLSLDYSPKALEKLGPDLTLEKQVQANVDFYSEINKHIKDHFQGKTTSMFIYSSMEDKIVEKLAETRHLDYYGCDGRPWSISDGGKLEGEGKTLVGREGQRFIDAAKANHKKSIFLIENHNMANADIPLLEKGLPEVLKMNVDQLIYYYYPRNIEDPDRLMGILKKQLVNFKK